MARNNIAMFVWNNDIANEDDELVIFSTTSYLWIMQLKYRNMKLHYFHSFEILQQKN